MSEERDGWRLAFHPGAFRRSLLTSDAQLCVNHRVGIALAKEGSDSLAFVERPDGLYFSATVWRWEWADIVRDARRNGRLKGCSVSWRADSQVSERFHASGIERILAARLLEVSLMIGGADRWPAFPGTWIALEHETLAAA